VAFSVRGVSALSFSDSAYFFEPLLRLAGLVGSIRPDRLRTIVYDMIDTFVEAAWLDSSLTGGSADAVTAAEQAAQQYPEVQRR
jgi:hypothetical protein